MPQAGAALRGRAQLPARRLPAPADPGGGPGAVGLCQHRPRRAAADVLWPNFTININPGFGTLSLDVWIPDGPNHTKGFSEQYCGPGVSEEFAKELIEFNKQVGVEDDDLTNSVQRGLLGGIPERGRF